MANSRDRIFVASIDLNDQEKAYKFAEQIKLPDGSKKAIIMSRSISQGADLQLYNLTHEVKYRFNGDVEDINIYSDNYLASAADYNHESALPLIYAQMHKIAAENPDAKIDFCYHGTLTRKHMGRLVSFFFAHREMMPANISLSCITCPPSTNETYSFPTITGKGLIDYNYHENMSAMVQHANEAAEPLKHEENADFNDPILQKFDYENNAELFLNKREVMQTPEQQLAKLDDLIKQSRSNVTVFEDRDEIYTESDNQNKVNLQEKFYENLTKLHKALSDDINAQKANNISDKNIQTSSAMSVAKETCTLLVNINKSNTSKEEKIQHIHQFELNCKKTARWSNFWKSIAVIAIIALGIVTGAVAGAGIGILAGAWSGPGAVATGFVGLFTGAATGASIGLTVGAAATGMVTGAISAGLLFRDTPVTAAVTLTSEYGVRALGAKSNFAN